MQEKVPHKSYSCRGFWSAVISEGFKKSREGFGLAIEIGMLFLGLAFIFIVWYSRHHKNFDVSKWEDFVNYWVAVIPIGVGLGWLLSHIIRTPYKIYKEQFEKINELELKLYEFEHQRAPLVVQCQEREMPNGMQSHFRILLTNPNPTQGYDGAQLRLKELSPPLAHVHESNQSTDQLQLTAIDFEPLDIKYGTIKAGITATVPIFTIIEQDDTMVFRFTGTLPTVHESLWNNFNQFLIKPNTDYILTFEASANGTKPAIKHFKLSVSDALYTLEPII